MGIRKLASIQQITALTSIEGADRIVAASILGWQVIVLKEEFRVNDLGVFFEIDSFLPASDHRYDFLTKDLKTWEGKQGYRLRTRKLKKTISQGLLLPLKDFPELKHYAIGSDVTEILKIEKWELPEPSQINMRSPGVQQARFPWFIPKTDEERVQNLPNVIEQNKGKYFEVTEKLNGTSATYFFGGPDKEFGVCSRNLWLKNRNKYWYHRLWLRIKSWFKTIETERINSYWKLAKKYKLDEILPKLGKQYAFQGEIIGEGIQKNPYKLKEQEFYIFNIYDIENFRYLNPLERTELIKYINNNIQDKGVPLYLKHVPIIEVIQLDSFNSIQEIIDHADGQSLINPKGIREGIVLKREDGKFSFKSISNKYLLKEE